MRLSEVRQHNTVWSTDSIVPVFTLNTTITNCTTTYNSIEYEVKLIRSTSKVRSNHQNKLLPSSDSGPIFLYSCNFHYAQPHTYTDTRTIDLQARMSEMNTERPRIPSPLTFRRHLGKLSWTLRQKKHVKRNFPTEQHYWSQPDLLQNKQIAAIRMEQVRNAHPSRAGSLRKGNSNARGGLLFFALVKPSSRRVRLGYG